MTKARTADINNYLEIFNNEINLKAREMLGDSSEDLDALLLSRLKYRVMVSTTEGVGIEYIPSATENILEYSSSGLSKMLVRQYVSYNGYAMELNGGSEFYVETSQFYNTLPFLMLGSDNIVTLKGCTLYFPEVTIDVHHAEFHSNRDIEYWSEANAVRRSFNLIFQALTEKNKALSEGLEISEYVKNHKQRSVLLLGSYSSTGRPRIDAIKQLLTKKYNVFVIDDIPENPNLTLAQKVNLVGNLCRFVVIDDSEPSGHIQEMEIAKNLDWITILTHADGRRATFMNASNSISNRHILEFDYTQDDLEENLEGAVRWAESTFEEFKDKLTKVYPWRI